MFRQDINGLRGWAVVSVILYHFGFSGFAGGFVGVDIFFVISGFLMTGIVVKGLEAGFTSEGRGFSLIQFYLARARRIVPALVGVGLLTLVIGWVLLSPNEYKVLGSHLISAIGFFSNIKFFGEAGYFDSSSHEKLLLHTWSLSVEWQFYLIFPLLLLSLWKFWHGRRPLIILIAAGFGASFLMSFLVTRANPSAAFYLLPTRAWEMLAGALVFFLPNDKALSEGVRRLIEGVGFALIILSIAIFDSSTSWPGWQALVPVLATGLILLGNRQNSIWTSGPIFQWLGSCSYSLYLWHWPFFVLLVYLQQQYDLGAISIALGLTGICGWLSYCTLEKPLSKKLSAMPRSAEIGLLAVIVLLVLALGIWVRSHNGFPDRVSPEVVSISNEAKNRNPRTKECFTTTDSKPFPECTYGGDQLGVIVIGDSHAASVIRSVEKALPSKGLNALDWTLNDCQIISGIKDADNPANRCGRFVSEKISSASKLDHNVPFLIVDRLSSVFYGPNEADRAGEVDHPKNYFDSPYRSRSAAYREEMRRGIISTACEFSKTHSVYMVRPIPELKINVPKMMARTMIRTGELQRVSISLDEYHQRHEFSWVTQDMAAKACGVKILDPLPYLCSDGRCWGDVGGLPIYFDDDHLNERGARLLVPMFQRMFAPLGDEDDQVVPHSTGL